MILTRAQFEDMPPWCREVINATSTWAFEREIVLL